MDKSFYTPDHVRLAFEHDDPDGAHAIADELGLTVRERQALGSPDGALEEPAGELRAVS